MFLIVWKIYIVEHDSTCNLWDAGNTRERDWKKNGLECKKICKNNNIRENYSFDTITEREKENVDMDKTR